MAELTPQPAPTTIAIGRLADLPTDRAVPVADGSVVVTRTSGGVRALRNLCLHQDLPLTDGHVRDGVLICPHHFWRYDIASGQLRSQQASRRCLISYDVSVIDGEVYVTLPSATLPSATLPPRLEPEAIPPSSLRTRLLERAGRWDRAEAYARDNKASTHDQSET